MAKKRILGTEKLFEETEVVTAAFADQPDVLTREIPISRVVPSRFNARRTYGLASQDELARSMAEHGFIGALDGRELPDGRVELAYGSRRLLAAKAAGLRTVPVTLRDWSDAQMCFVSLAENLARENLIAGDEAAMVRQMRDDLALAIQDISRGTGKSDLWVKERLAVGEASTAPDQKGPEEQALEQIVASLLKGAPVYSQDVPFDEALDPLRQTAPGDSPERNGRPKPQPAGSTLVPPGAPWVATGSTMLVLAMEALNGFDAASLPDGEIDEALNWLNRRAGKVATLIVSLEDGGQT